MSKTERRLGQEEQKSMMMASVYACACKTKYVQMAMMRIVYELQDRKV